MLDRSNGYEALAGEFMSRRSSSTVGTATTRAWARTLRPGSTVLDLGCGHGIPITQALVEEGLAVAGIDASPSMVAAFRARFPRAAVECAAAEDSHYFDRRFDGIVAWGLMFLLSREAQAAVIRNAASALAPGGKFLFTAPGQECAWSDTLTGRTSISLGGPAYRRLLEAAGLTLVAEADDEGQNHYYFVQGP